MLKRNFNIAPISVNPKELIDEIYGVLKKEFKDLEKFYISIEISNKEGGIDFESFEKFRKFDEKNLPKNIKEISIYVSERGKLSFSLILNSTEFLSANKCKIEVEIEEKLLLIEQKLRKFFIDKRTNYFFLHSFLGAPLIIFSILFSVSILKFLTYIQSIEETIFLVIAYILIPSMTYVLFKIFPKVEFKFLDKKTFIENIRTIVGLLIIGMIGTGLYNFIANIYLK